MITQNIFPFSPYRQQTTKKKQRNSKNFSLSCCVILYYIYNARAHIAVLMGLYYVTFWLNRFLANNNNLAFFWAQFEKEKFNILFSCFLHNLSENLFISTQTDCDWYCATLLCCLENIPPNFFVDSYECTEFHATDIALVICAEIFYVWMMNAIPKARWS